MLLRRISGIIKKKRPKNTCCVFGYSLQGELDQPSNKWAVRKVTYYFRQLILRVFNAISSYKTSEELTPK